MGPHAPWRDSVLVLLTFGLLGACRPAQERSLTTLVDQVKGSVVNIDVLATHGRGRTQVQGSGFFIRDDGLVLTNQHVVDGANTVRVRTTQGESLEGLIVGSDTLTDLAVLRVKGGRTSFPTVTWADSALARAGESVVAIGSPYGLSLTVTHGIVSAVAREVLAGPYDEFLQTDAAINPGNSGGPLFNLEGQVVGINTAGVKNANNIGFAIPSNVARALLPQLIEHGRVRRGWLGVALDDVGPQLTEALKVPRTEGALVKSVVDKSPAASAGLKSQDIILEVNGQPVASAGGLRRTLGMLVPQTSVRLRVFRGSELTELSATLGDNPEAGRVDTAPKAAASEDAEKQRRLGLTLEDRGADVVISLVAANSPAERAGVTAGMRLTAVGTQPVSRTADALTLLRTATPDTLVVLHLIDRDGDPTLKALRIPPSDTP